MTTIVAPVPGSGSSSLEDISPTESSTHDQFTRSHGEICSTTASVISLPESEDGPKLSPSPIGPRIDPSGLDPVPVSRSVSPAKERESKTSDTYGRSSMASLTSAVLQSCLASRLVLQLAGRGSMEYSLTWRKWDMPGRGAICALRASARRTSDNVCSGWPTASASDHKGGYAGGRIRNGKLSTDRLDVVAQMAGWPTPKASEGEKETRSAEGAAREVERKKCPSLATLAYVASWPTVLAKDRPSKTDRPEAFQSLAKTAGWATPTATDGGRGRGGPRLRDTGVPLSQQAPGAITSGSTSETENRGALNPDLARWLMGFPEEWGSCGATAMQSSRKSRRNSSNRSLS